MSIAGLALAGLAAALLILMTLEQAHIVYGVPGQTANGGFHVPGTSCGFEVWGTPGVFCGDY